MKKFLAGLLIGLLLATTTFALANPQVIKLIVNGQEIQADVPPQNINGRVMVPARYVAEALGAKVEWDAANNAVVITSQNTQPAVPNTSTTSPTNGIMEENGEGSNVSTVQEVQEFVAGKDDLTGPNFPGFFFELRKKEGNLYLLSVKYIKKFPSAQFPANIEFITNSFSLQPIENLYLEGEIDKIIHYTLEIPAAQNFQGVKLTWENNGLKSLFVPADFAVE